MRRVLVVDDEPDIRFTLKECLEAFLGMPVLVELASNGLEAQERLRRGPSFDVVIADQRMPGLVGTDLLAWLRTHEPSSLRVLLSAYTQAGTREAAVRADVHYFLAKPVDLPQLLRVVREATPPKPVVS